MIRATVILLELMENSMFKILLLWDKTNEMSSQGANMLESFIWQSANVRTQLESKGKLSKKSWLFYG